MVKLAQIERTVSMADTGHAAQLPSALDWADARRGSRQSRGYGREWDAVRKLALVRDRYRCVCAECRATGRLLPATEVDHVVPKARGGTDELGNVQSINRDCHRRKTLREVHGA